MKILFVGDVVGRCGRKALAARLDRLIDQHLIDLVVVNGENAAAVGGILCRDSTVIAFNDIPAYRQS